MSWLGTSTTSEDQCNRNKGPYFAVKQTNNGVAEFLRPTRKENPSEKGFSYRDGNMICAETELGAKRCLALPAGQKTYEVSWTRSQGLSLHP